LGTARAGGGFPGIDHEIGFDQSGIWARKYQSALELGVIATEVGGASLADGCHRRLGAGTGVGYWSAKRQTPISVEILPRGFSIWIIEAIPVFIE
jgi:hypothetical protein